ncbi:hypothetical protein LTR08_003133 [Meristemomyces frigidus]|nr:hypothetical protein LTR08_003133 [Meristemomyces frigidus]
MARLGSRWDLHPIPTHTKVLALHAEQIVELWIDGQHHFGGDLYCYARAAVTLHLEPGVHTIDVRLVRDVLISDIVGDVNGPLATLYASVALRNHAPTTAFVYDIEATHNRCEAKLLGLVPIVITPGQTRPVAFKLACVPPAASSGPLTPSLNHRIEGDETA